MHFTRIISLAAIAGAVAAFVACSAEKASMIPVGDGFGLGIGPDGAVVDPDEDAATSNDAQAGADALAPTGETAVDAKINGVTRTLDRAQFGTETDDDGNPRAHVEAHLGGDPACPDPSADAAPAAQPEYTLVVSNVPRGNPGDVFTKAANGVTTSYLDFKGDQLTSKPLTTATAVTVTIIESTSSRFEIEIDARFAEGTVKGRVSAEFCQSLSL